MSRVNICLKRTFIISNIFLAIIAGIIAGLSLLVHATYRGPTLPLEVKYHNLLFPMSILAMAIATLGAYGAGAERKLCLIAFLMLSIPGGSLVQAVGINAASDRSKLEGIVEAKFRELLPLDKASDDVRAMVEGTQRLLRCCGLFSYDDWKGNIPNSCVCDEMEETGGKCLTVDYRMITIPLSKSKSIYTKSCFPIALTNIMFIADIMIGVYFTLSILAMFGGVLSIFIIYQIPDRPTQTQTDPDRPTVLRSAPAIFIAQLPKYQELIDPPPPYY